MRGHLPALDHGVMDPAPAPYLIRISGHLGATVLSAFPALEPRRHGAHTVLTGLLDRSASPQAEELSPSELRVLRYLPTNLSRPEIASELSVSVNTVNTHVRNIYAKLGASDRSSAVQRARKLRLLSAGLTR